MDKEKQLSNQIFIQNLSYRVKEVQIRAYFEQCGKVTDVQLMKNGKTGEFKGFGIITFEKPQYAEFALKNLNNQNLEGRKVRIERVSSQKIYEMTNRQLEIEAKERNAKLYHEIEEEKLKTKKAEDDQNRKEKRGHRHHSRSESFSDNLSNTDNDSKDKENKVNKHEEEEEQYPPVQFLPLENPADIEMREYIKEQEKINQQYWDNNNQNDQQSNPQSYSLANQQQNPQSSSLANQQQNPQSYYQVNQQQYYQTDQQTPQQYYQMDQQNPQQYYQMDQQNPQQYYQVNQQQYYQMDQQQYYQMDQQNPQPLPDYYVDTNGVEYFLDPRVGQYYYVASDGNSYYVTEQNEVYETEPEQEQEEVPNGPKISNTAPGPPGFLPGGFAPHILRPPEESYSRHHSRHSHHDSSHSRTRHEYSDSIVSGSNSSKKEREKYDSQRKEKDFKYQHHSRHHH